MGAGQYELAGGVCHIVPVPSWSDVACNGPEEGHMALKKGKQVIYIQLLFWMHWQLRIGSRCQGYNNS
jgi:hypothetical protein